MTREPGGEARVRDDEFDRAPLAIRPRRLATIDLDPPRQPTPGQGGGGRRLRRRRSRPLSGRSAGPLLQSLENRPRRGEKTSQQARERAGLRGRIVLERTLDHDVVR